MLKLFKWFALAASYVENQFGSMPSFIRVSLRFLLCGFTTYVAFAILKPMGDLIVGRENELIIYGFDNPEFIPIIMFAIIFGYIGLGLSIVSVALFSSFLPKR